MELHKMLDRVHDPESFISFARALAADRAHAVSAQANHPASPWGPDAGGWQNTTIEDFLDAAVSWAEDSQFGLHQGLSQHNTWKQFAVFLYCGKIYE